MNDDLVFDVSAEVDGPGGGSDGVEQLCGRFTAERLAKELAELLAMRIRDMLMSGSGRNCGDVLRIEIRDRPDVADRFYYDANASDWLCRECGLVSDHCRCVSKG